MVSHPLPSIDLELPLKLRDRQYRERFFLAEASAEIARQLIALRKRRKLSQTELADLADTHQPAVSRAEQADYHNWSFNTLRKLTDAMEGRLRVIIEPWEDIVSEYYPEDFKKDPLPRDETPDEQNAAHSDAAGASAATAGEPPRSIWAAFVDDNQRRFNRPLTPPQKRRRSAVESSGQDIRQ